MRHTNQKVTKGKAGNVSAANLNASRLIGQVVAVTLKGIQKEVASRAYRASNELRNASLYILRGQRSGRVYKVPNTHGKKASKATRELKKDYGHDLRGGQLYRASAPGEPPAVRTGVFRLSWSTRIHVEQSGSKFRATSAIENNIRVGSYLLGEMLEHGTNRIAPRPYKQAVVDRAMPKITDLYNKPYKI
jgi:hypothetical protein